MGVACYNIYIYNRQGTCLFCHEWLRPKSVSQGAGTVSDDQKMMFGLFFSLKTFSAAMDPKRESKSQLGAPLKIGESCTFHSFKTNNYKLHFMESLSGLKIVLNTDPEAGDLREALFYIYSSLYTDYVMKNPAYSPGQAFNCEGFTSRLHQYVKSLST